MIIFIIIRLPGKPEIHKYIIIISPKYQIVIMYVYSVYTHKGTDFINFNDLSSSPHTFA